MSKTKYDISWWYPSLESWIISSLEMVSLFNNRLTTQDFESKEKANEARNVFHSLPEIKDGYQLSEGDLKLVRKCCDMIYEKTSFLTVPKEKWKCKEDGLNGWRTLLLKEQLTRFKKQLPYSVGFMPKPIGIRPTPRLDRPVNDYPINDDFMHGVLNTYVYPKMQNDKKHLVRPEGRYELFELLSFYFLYFEKASNVTGWEKQNPAANKYITNQMQKIKLMLNSEATKSTKLN
ncbi:hypothetical protein [Alteromonas facilis]|uniref:hypothetical protein n=1 Tax=Alteromonas facilis TaxID=2048004 RepID=UPI000C291CE5|nr:hypothetical protein [Alteromonas facilis]